MLHTKEIFILCGNYFLLWNIFSYLEFRESGKKDRVCLLNILLLHVLGTSFTSMVFEVIWFSE
jgi:hypothetical protein